jgi:hypothetical protein
MIGRNEQTPTNESSTSGNAPAANGAPEGPAGSAPGPGSVADRLPPADADRAAPGAGPEPGSRSGVDRAEELASQLAQRVAALSSFATRKLVGFAYRAREVAQDFWADVQDFRRGERP